MKWVPCEVCASPHQRVLFEGRDRILKIPGAFKIVQCMECGLIFVNPQPEAEELKEYYPSDYYIPDPSHYRNYYWLRRKVLETYFGYGRQDSSKSLSLFKKMVLFPFRAKYRYSIPFTQRGRILDIGCGNGTELYKLKAMGWETYGVEMDEGASAQARSKGLEVIAGDLFKAAYADCFFHVVRMSFVLEHLSCPKETLREIKRILRPQGRIYISVQNARSLNYWLFGERWFSLDAPRHLFSFTPKTIRRLLSSLDLKVEQIRFDSGTRTFRESLQYWINDRYPERGPARVPPAVARNLLLKHLLRLPCWLADRLRLGDLMHLEVVKQ